MRCAWLPCARQVMAVVLLPTFVGFTAFVWQAEHNIVKAEAAGRRLRRRQQAGRAAPDATAGGESAGITAAAAAAAGEPAIFATLKRKWRELAQFSRAHAQIRTRNFSS